MTPDFTNFRTEIDGVKVMVASGSTVGINICHWIDVHAPDADYDEQTALLDIWMQKHNLMYYGAPRECFNEWGALDDARRKGYDGIVMEDLS
jgi:hypothetical protein